MWPMWKEAFFFFLFHSLLCKHALSVTHKGFKIHLLPMLHLFWWEMNSFVWLEWRIDHSEPLLQKFNLVGKYGFFIPKIHSATSWMNYTRRIEVVLLQLLGSSLPSPQSLCPSQKKLAMTHLLLLQANWLGLQMWVWQFCSSVALGQSLPPSQTHAGEMHVLPLPPQGICSGLHVSETSNKTSEYI